VDFQCTKDKLDNTGCGMCLAKWTQTTIYLHNGHTHSCHHPRTHKIPLTELDKNPTALHNTRYKKLQRKTMLKGGRPEECDYCWNVEDNSNEFSDRIYKSHSEWSAPHHEDIVKSKWNIDYNPRYVEVVFSSACNLKCSYCAPHISSKWMEEIQKHGEYPTSTKFNNLDHLKKIKAIPIPNREHNPYVEAFWKWWPDLYRDLHTFRITGGEPLLSRDSFKVLDFILEQDSPNKELTISINTNMMAPDNLVDEFINKVNRITKEKRVKEFQVFTSIDTWGEDAEYIRDGLVFKKFWDNCNKFLEKCEIPSLTFMVTYNALSVFNFHKFIQGVYDLKNNYRNEHRLFPTNCCVIDISYLRYPSHQTVKILPRNTWGLIKKQINLMKKLQKDEDGVEYFTPMEISKLERIFDWLESKNDRKELLRNKKDFGIFFREHDKRRGTNFLKIFPNLKKLYGVGE
jgi:organic radical activating enzyme